MSKTPFDIKRGLQARGITIETWAKENGFPSYAVRAVLSGKNKALYGRGHEIAVRLGIKVLPK